MKGLLWLAATLACGMAASPTKAARPSALPDGSWGGEHIAITVGATGSKIEFDCAHGRIDGAFALDAAGEFELSGTFSKEHGGPIRRDEREQRLPAIYSGRVNGDRMTLTIRLRDAKEILGDFTLGRDKAPRLVKCL
jgi:hypothetical protein